MTPLLVKALAVLPQGKNFHFVAPISQAFGIAHYAIVTFVKGICDHAYIHGHFLPICCAYPSNLHLFAAFRGTMVFSVTSYLRTMSEQ